MHCFHFVTRKIAPLMENFNFETLHCRNSNLDTIDHNRPAVDFLEHIVHYIHTQKQPACRPKTHPDTHPVLGGIMRLLERPIPEDVHPVHRAGLVSGTVGWAGRIRGGVYPLLVGYVPAAARGHYSAPALNSYLRLTSSDAAFSLIARRTREPCADSVPGKGDG